MCTTQMKKEHIFELQKITVPITDGNFNSCFSEPYIVSKTGNVGIEGDCLELVCSSNDKDRRGRVNGWIPIDNNHAFEV